MALSRVVIDCVRKFFFVTLSEQQDISSCLGKDYNLLVHQTNNLVFALTCQRIEL